MEELKKHILSFFPFAQKKMGFDRPPRLFLKDDGTNAKNILGKTAQYNPEDMSITLFTTKRHPKDILRSFSHELVHHAQNCRGDFDGGVASEDGYAQNDSHLREMEREAYEQGNLCFRDWEDSIKYGGEQTMSLNENKLREAIRGALKKIMTEDFVEDSAKEEAAEGEQKGVQEYPEGENAKRDDDEKSEGMKYKRDDKAKTGANRYGGGGYLDYGEEDEELEEAVNWGGNKGDKSKTHPGEKDYTTKKGEKVKTGRTKGEKAYEDPSKGEKITTKGGTKRGSKKGDEAYVNEREEVEESVSHPADDREGNRAQGRRVKKTSTGERIEEVEHEEEESEKKVPLQEWYQHSLFDRLIERFTRE